MVIFWLLVAAFVISFILMYIFYRKADEKYDDIKKRKLFKTLGGVFNIITYVSFWFGLVMILNKPSKDSIEKTCSNYYQIKNRITEFEKLDPEYKESLVFALDDLKKDIEEINREIRNNNKNKDSFLKIWYSEKIGNLEEIRYE